MTFEEIKNMISTKANDTAALNASIKFDLGEDQKIHIDGNGGENVVTTEDKEADTVISISKDNLAKMISGDMNPMGAFMSGKVKVKGDMSKAMKLQSLLS